MELHELTAREQIRDAYAAYTHSGDRFRLADLAACFVPEGVLQVVGRSEAVGRDQIVAMLGGRSRNKTSAAASDAEPAPIIRHFIANIRFDSVAAQEIRTSAYFQVLTRAGLDHWGRYRDVFVPFDGTWLIAHRTVRVDAAVPGGWYET